MQNTNFYDIFFTDETSFYLDNPVGARWLKDQDNLIFSKKKEEKLERGLSLMQMVKLRYIYMEMNFNTENYLKVLEEAVEEMKEIKSSELYTFKWTMQDIIGRLKRLNFI